jgi:hypothetical protein
MSHDMIALSCGRGHGTATRKNKTGKAKCFSQGKPPARKTTASVSAAPHTAAMAGTMRQSALEMTTGCSPARTKEESAIEVAATILPPREGRLGCGRSGQRRAKSSTERRGTRTP